MRNPARRRLKGSAGYTLTEMLVVVGVIALIAAVLVPSLMGQMQRARAKAGRVQVDNIASAVEMFRSDVGHYPTSAEGGLKALLTNGSTIEGWTGPYLKDAKTLNDPWNREIRYELAADAETFAVTSLGADGKVGGVGPNLDLQAPIQAAAAASGK
ncbi:type II secretion system major pseudopilin GspG [Caulobacter segnis]|uniref:type II secretion system major pseudopilin GspG n=1 Tax=Caulobacter segnis TaxID=88688 RepID=UPI0028556C1A|nr:type II secretion system major pseudopilin GspG [Caulobacter segnis]MDR6624326.1 general secretion pathway protein G [Caulobacter segnis]